MLLSSSHGLSRLSAKVLHRSESLFRKPFQFFCALSVSTAFLACGCSSGTYPVKAVSGLPPGQSAASSNTYIGTQSPLNWTFTVDDTQNAFSYQSLPTDGSTSKTASGDFVPEDGFLNLGAAGIALELPGAGALLRPGDNTRSPVMMLEQEDCFALSANQRYLMEGMVHTTSANSPVLIYRRADAVATTTPDGTSWSFANAEYIGPTGSQISLVYEGQPSPNAFSGSCSNVDGAAAVTIDTAGAYNLPTTFRFSRSGLSIADYSTYTSAIGVSQPTATVTAKSLTTSNFRGFQVEYSDTAITQPVSFVPALDGSSALNGGIYPADDLSQTPSTDDLFEFGSPSSTLNGLFPSTTITVLDPRGGCPANGVGQGDIGISPSGVATCRLHLSAIVGQINGKAFIAAAGIDLTVPSSSAPDIQFYLIQQ